MALIGVMLAFFANSFIDTGYGYQALVRAEAAATSGAQDALLQLDRNANFAATCGCGSNGYSVPVGSSTAVVTVNASSTAGIVTILSAATVSSRTRKISVVAAVNASTSQVTILSWQVIP